MRVGVLPFGSPPTDLDALLEPLRAADVDVVTAESSVATEVDAAREAQRLARADCDGVVLFTDGTYGLFGLIAEAALYLSGTSLLLTGTPGDSTFFDAAGALEELGAQYQRQYHPSSLEDWPERVGVWLRENRKDEWQRGSEAARTLYGQRLYVPTEFTAPDVGLWGHQLGVVVTRSPDGASFTAEYGDAYGALTAQLMRLMVNTDVLVSLISITEPRHPGGTEDGIACTFARITRRAGRFRCLLLRGALNPYSEEPDSTSNVWFWRCDCSEDALYEMASSPHLHALPGDHIGAMRAACEALDIEPVILR
jgi:L-fucose isomerase-like protein